MYRVFSNDNNILRGKDRTAGSIPNSIGCVPFCSPLLFIVNMPEEYQWSSYATHAYGKKSPLIEAHVYYESLGKTEEERQAKYREFVKEGIKEGKLKEIRDSVVSGKGYGTEEYLQIVEETIKARLRKGRRGRPKKMDA